ncbi:protein of unknown function (plasmid) [Cupriavidus taiwanensis]|uniref:Uncharacterized protein n=1 Tax=Cupriavidus taiwanensis TaxID=164546 RepID=A0A375EEL4_9BURK|nr:protein of unknown function [Cupriavidus taiwanensis]SOZ72401.1 protein of unknown function [Cupriavidus taiwanensis]SOZ74756.1 protein of unknown function [Cupriavidus taiwanensis]SPA03603.1 protein of unknown function [Cupriavidus taiwanensis]SPA11504.1 protein of unknown function [Cupriavidus taiwanensis]
MLIMKDAIFYYIESVINIIKQVERDQVMGPMGCSLTMERLPRPTNRHRMSLLLTVTDH